MTTTINPSDRYNLLSLYQCHKQVRAGKIQEIREIPHTRGARLSLWTTLGAPVILVDISREWADKHKPVTGGYYVVYEDGYTSYSPKAAFESGYTLCPAVVPWDNRGTDTGLSQAITTTPGQLEAERKAERSNAMQQVGRRTLCDESPTAALHRAADDLQKSDGGAMPDRQEAKRESLRRMTSTIHGMPEQDLSALQSAAARVKEKGAKWEELASTLKTMENTVAMLKMECRLAEQHYDEAVQALAAEAAK